MNNIIRKLIKLLFIKPIIKVQLPLWLIIFGLFIPVMAYIDIIFIGKHDYLDYVILCSIETLFIYTGYFLGIGTNKLKEVID